MKEFENGHKRSLKIQSLISTRTGTKQKWIWSVQTPSMDTSPTRKASETCLINFFIRSTVAENSYEFVGEVTSTQNTSILDFMIKLPAPSIS